jgi:hypothetical protein
MTTPDFETLRAERNANVLESFKNIAEEHGVPIETLKSNFNPNSCYCACGTGGPCEHKWDGPDYESEGDGGGYCVSVTCSRCGTTAMSHDMRYLP